MGACDHRLKAAPNAVLVAGVLAAGAEVLGFARALVEARYGAVRLASEAVPFTWSRYYEREMGTGLLRQFLAFERAIDPGRLGPIKAESVGLELAHAPEGCRTFNLDPGYLTLHSLVVASTKEASYRIYLGGGIYAQPMLAYVNKGFRPFEWTYPDYSAVEHLAFFRAVRDDALDRGVIGASGSGGGDRR